MIQKYSITFSYKDFIDLFIHLVMNMLASSPQPRISEEIKRVLLLAKNSKVGD